MVDEEACLRLRMFRFNKSGALEAFYAFARNEPQAQRIYQQFSLTKDEFLRYLGLGIIKTSGFAQLADGNEKTKCEIQLGNKIMWIEVVENRIVAHDMQLLRGKNRHTKAGGD
ncbi:hypothetical protein [Rhizobium sp.]|uniref:hypothetical protein n=1 Tax=Rhizobium sp. TaxID=391 RepID=UPI00289C7221